MCRRARRQKNRMFWREQLGKSVSLSVQDVYSWRERSHWRISVPLSQGQGWRLMAIPVSQWSSYPVRGSACIRTRRTGDTFCRETTALESLPKRRSTSSLPMLKSVYHSQATLFHRNLTSSSALVGCIATVESKSLFLAPIFTATPKPCIISELPSPKICIPTILSSGP